MSDNMDLNVKDEVGGQFDDFDEVEDEISDTIDPGQVVTLTTHSGQNYYVPVTDAVVLQTVLDRSNLTFSRNMEYWVNGTPVGELFMVGPGAKVLMIGNVKGG